MQFKLVSFIALAVFAAPGLAQTIDYEGYASTVECSGSAFGCSDGGAVCCSLPTGYGYSAQFNNLPAGSQGQGYTNNACTDFMFSVFGPGTKCYNGGGTRATNLNWFHSPQGRRAVYARAAEAATECSSPSYFKYDDASGVERKIKVPNSEGAAQTIANFYLAGNLTALAAYADY